MFACRHPIGKQPLRRSGKRQQPREGYSQDRPQCFLAARPPSRSRVLQVRLLDGAALLARRAIQRPEGRLLPLTAMRWNARRRASIHHFQDLPSDQNRWPATGRSIPIDSATVAEPASQSHQKTRAKSRRPHRGWADAPAVHCGRPAVNPEIMRGCFGHASRPRWANSTGDPCRNIGAQAKQLRQGGSVQRVQIRLRHRILGEY